MAHDEHHSVADVVAKACLQRGVKRVFGVPGGGSCLDLIEAFDRAGIEVVLCRAETPAMLMAAADAETRNGFGVAFTTQGPGMASAVNGLAYSALDRAPVLLISDTWLPDQLRFDTHQVIDQKALAAPLIKAHSRLETDDPAAELDAVVQAMLSPRWGAGYVELSSSNARRQVRQQTATVRTQLARPLQTSGSPQDLLCASRRPVMVVGLEAREEGAQARIMAMAQRLQCPVLTTYKAKGIVSDTYGGYVGHFTGAAAERPCVEAADLIILCGLDPVELIGKPWPYAAPVLDLALVAHPVHYVEPAASVHGPLAAAIDSVLPHCRAADWSEEDARRYREAYTARLLYQGKGEGVSPQYVVQQAQRAAPDAAITVDAGAHMFSAMAFWQAQERGGALISDGLSTMGLSLPGGIAKALHDHTRPTLVFTGDGGLKMSIAELATAAQYGARVCVIVFNDGALSLIALKQEQRGLRDSGVRWPRADFASIARGFGVQAFSASTPEQYAQALVQAVACTGPCLIDVHVDPSGYRAQSVGLRG